MERNSRLKFRAWDESNKYMAYQGTPGLKTLWSFMFHWGDYPLQQFTGIHDIIGKEIYEGDFDEYGYIVTYAGDLEYNLGMPYAGFYFQKDNFEKWHNLECDHVYKIIGNIYENLEILKQL
jgi:uncharacterized phage protein (TIGR01671 family)